MTRPSKRIPGYDVDRVDVSAGLRELQSCGCTSPATAMIIEHALMQWALGEEEARRGAIDRSFYGVDLTCWIRVLSAAMAGAQIDALPAGSEETR